MFNLKKQQRKQKLEARREAESEITFVTRIEVLCQGTGITFHLTTDREQQKFTCHRCGKERFTIHNGKGRGNVYVDYQGADNSTRRLDKVIPDPEHHVFLALAQYTATDGTFILVSQDKP